MFSFVPNYYCMNYSQIIGRFLFKFDVTYKFLLNMNNYVNVPCM